MILASLSLISLCIPAMAGAYVTENVIVVVLCGVRSSEFLLDTAHTYIPNIWNGLKSKAVINTNMQTLSHPATGGGNFTIATGVIENKLTFPFETEHYRTDSPTVFEYFSKTFNLLTGSNYFLAGGEDKVKRADYSLHPLYGPNYKAVMLYPGGNINSDATTRDELYNIIDTDHPRLIYVLLKTADIKGHNNNWDGYLNAIKIQDQIIYDLWNKIESDPIYAGKTALIVTGDHGRHDDQHGGFVDHGQNLSDGDRIVPFIALGPDFRSNLVLSNTPRKLHDVAPTIGELLGFKTYFSEGRVMWEIFKTSNAAAHRGKTDENWPSLSVYNGVQHVAYQGTPRLITEGNEDIRYFNVNSSSYKSTPVKVSESFSFSVFPRIAAGSSGLHMIYQGWLPSDGTYSNDYDWQHIYYRKSADGGATWTPGLRLSSNAATLPDTFWMEKGAIAASGDMVTVAFAKNLSIINTRTSTDGGNTWNSIISYSAVAPRGPELAISNSRIHMVFYDQEELARTGGNRDIYYSRSDDQGSSWISRVRLSTDAANDLRPRLAVNGDTVHVVWESDQTGAPQIFYRSSADAGATWSSSVQLSGNSALAKSPSIAAAGSKLVAAWIDFREGTSSKVYFKVSNNGGASWSSDMKLSNNSGIVRNFDMRSDGTKFYFVWEENSTGVWKLYTRTM